MGRPVADLRLFTASAAKLALAAGLFATGSIVACSYRLDASLLFYNGLIGTLALLWIAKLRWPGRALVQFPANTLILFLVLLPPIDWIYRLALARPEAAGQTPDVAGQPYSFERAQADPRKFQAWWRHFLIEWETLSRQITMRDPERALPFVLKPGSAGTFFQSQVHVNSLGFRDREFQRAKQGQYRIVAIGESTTMGFTLTSDDLPWPKVLERIIRQDFGSTHDIEVINAGVAGYDLPHSLIRLKRDILPLQPDMIICYHGYNAFHHLDEALDAAGTPVAPVPPPAFQSRPLRLLADVEHRLRLARYKREQFAKPLTPEALARVRHRLMESPLAKHYRQLISTARAEGIQLVLLSHNLAVNAASPPNVIRFYEGGFPRTRYCIQANTLQTALLQQLALEFPDVLFVDTSRDLDGRHECFIDLVHFNQRGRNQLATTVYRAVRPRLLEATAGRESPSESGARLR